MFIWRIFHSLIVIVKETILVIIQVVIPFQEIKNRVNEEVRLLEEEDSDVEVVDRETFMKSRKRRFSSGWRRFQIINSISVDWRFSYMDSVRNWHAKPVKENI